MNMSMGFLKPVGGAVKKYKSLAPSVIVIIISAVLFTIALSVGGSVKEKMEKSVRTADSVPSLLQKIPSRRETDQIKIYMDKLQGQVDTIKELALQSSRRDLITYEYKVFPEPDDSSGQIYLGFGKQYRAAIEKLVESINALDAPSEAEIRAKTGGAKPAAGYGGGSVKTVAAQDPRVDALCFRRAQEISVYVNPSAFAWYSFWDSYESSGKTQALEDCWDSQAAFWIYEDIVDTIKKMNGITGDVQALPVKRLLGISFNGPVTAGQNTRSGYGRGMTGPRDKPNYVTSTLSSLFMDASPTARRCDENVDIVHFVVSVLLDNHSIFPFIKELCSEKPHSFYPSVFEEPFIRQGDPVQSRHNQITILQSDIKIIDKKDDAHELYRYGKGAVVRLDLVCEYQFNRAGYDAIKPKAIKERLGQSVKQKEPGGGQKQPQPGGMRGPYQNMKK
ncbi:MAG: hypothetical protein ACYSO1_10880 [Planctomycetota bacterium]|jgi:hypothetical protein